MPNKLYQSKRWMRLKFVTERLSEKEIAEICGVSQVTINTWLKKHQLRREK